MKNKLMKSAFAALAAVTIGSTVAPVVSAASENNGDNSETQTFVVPQSSNSANNVVPKTTVTTSELSKEIAKAGSVTYENGVKTFEISDDRLELAIDKAYGNKFSVELAKKKHHAGVTKVKYYGHGNANIYLSKSMLNKIRSIGYGRGFKIVVSLIAVAAGVPSMGVAGGVITSVASSLVGAMLNQVKPYKVGRVFKIRGWKYVGWRYQ